MKKLLLSVLGASFLLFGACSQEEPVGGEKIPQGKGKLKIDLPVFTRTGAGNTRANVASEEGENTISSLYLLFFDQTEDQSGEYIAYTSVPMPAGEVSMGMNVDTQFTFPAGTSAEEAYSVMAIANISDGNYVETVADWMSQWVGKTQREVMADAAVSLPEQIIRQAELLMQGSDTKVAGSQEIHMLLHRAVARMDVTNTATTYDLVTTSVWNSYPTASVWGDGVMDYSAGAKRLERHYQVSAGASGNIIGGLYAFENQVANPEDYDKITTCLIVGMRPTGTSDPIEYYRVNMISDSGIQRLQRNHSYNLVIEGVAGPGAASELIAYLGESNKLIYTIGGWPIDDNGLTVQDDHSSLTIPTKTITMGRDGQTYEFQIHTFSTLDSPSPLSIRSQTYSPVAVNDPDNPGTQVAPIKATLDGNMLVVDAKSLNLGEESRSGIIVLTYAGLEISMNVSQSGQHDDFLIVTEPDGGITPFPAYSGIASGLIRVQASDDWTARLYMSGFSFNPSTAVAPEKIIQSYEGSSTSQFIIPDDIDSTVDKFRVYTNSFNTGVAPREAFIVIELDKDPENYSAVIMLSQNYVKAMYLWLPGTYPAGGLSAEGSDPNRLTTATATFDGTGAGLEPNIDGNSDEFIIASPLESNMITPWSAAIVQKGSTDDRARFEIVSVNGLDSSIPETYTDRTMHTVEVRAVGMNTSGRDYTATLKAMVDPGTFVDIELVQKSASFEFDRTSVPNLTHLGGTSEAIGMDIVGESMFWRIPEITLSQTAGPGATGRSLVNHSDPTIVVYDEFDNEVPFVLDHQYPKNFTFAVKFPIIYFPNRDINVAADVEVVVGAQGSTGGMSKTFKVNQDALTARPIVVQTNSGGGRGNLMANDYSGGLRDLLGGMASSAITLNLTNPIGSDVTILHRHNAGMDANTSWTNTYAFMDNNDGLFTMIADMEPAGMVQGLNNWGRGWSFKVSVPLQNVAGGTYYPELFDSKIWEFVANRVGTNVISQDIQDTRSGDPIRSLTYHDGSSTEATAWPASAVPFVKNGNGNGGLIIDPKSRVMYIGESLYIGDAGLGLSGQDDGTIAFWTNVAYYWAYTAKYGRAFSDMLIDDETEGGVPAPWDAVWGDNAIDHFDSYDE